MAKEINEDLGFRVSIKTLVGIGAAMATVISMWFVLQADIDEAKELPKPVIDRVEYDLKDELIRQTIMDTQEDVEAIKEQLEKMDQRLYDIQKER
jgi:ribosomal protein S13|tara:strand:+ start:752 stop:1036 length:285 start_codon:yes stop_codon:yes gene_type:complete